MRRGSSIYVAGHRGLVGSSISSGLAAKGHDRLIIRTRAELDLKVQASVEAFFEEERPEYVFLAAAKVGGILANDTFKADFISDNLLIGINVIRSAHKYGVRKLLNLGSSCIYPKFAQQPLREESLLAGSLEPTNEPYAIAKIAAIKLCRYYNEQYGTDFISVMPTNLYGNNDNFDLETSHVLPALIRKFHLARLVSDGRFDLIEKDLAIFGNRPAPSASPEAMENLLAKFGITKEAVTLWGTGEPYREFLHADDLAGACIFLMEKYGSKDIGEFVNIGTAEDIKIKDLAAMVGRIAGFEGDIRFDTTKPDGTPRKLLDVSRIRALGWRPAVKLQDGIEMVYKSYRALLETGDVHGGQGEGSR